MLAKECLEEFKVECDLRRLSPRTTKGYYNNTALFLNYLEKHDGIAVLEKISHQHITHSFRKWYATEIYKANGYDIALVQRLLQHSSAATTQRYIGIEPQRIEDAIQNHSLLI